MTKQPDFKEILIVHTWGLGDMILLTPVLNAVSRLHPEIKFSFLVFQKIAAVPLREATYVRDIDSCNWEPQQLLKSIYKLRKTKYHAVVFSSGVTAWKAGLYMFLLRAIHKIGEYRTVRFPFLTDYVRFNPDQSRTEGNYRLLETLLSLPDWKDVVQTKLESGLVPQFNLAPSELNFAAEFMSRIELAGKFVFGMHPGCMAKNKFRRWPHDYFVTLIQLLKARFDCSFIIIGGPDELEEAQYISRLTASTLLTHQPLGNVAAVIARCNFFINTDSGLGHVASCFDRKSLTIFGPGDERQTAPFSINSHIIRLDKPCAPCVHRNKQNCVAECLLDLTPQAVFERTVEILQQNGC
jgi:heptosyltransferase II